MATDEGQEQIVAEFEKSPKERIRCSLTKWRGKHLASIRLYYLADDGTWKPSPKGLTLSAKLIAELADGAVRLRDRADALGLTQQAVA